MIISLLQDAQNVQEKAEILINLLQNPVIAPLLSSHDTTQITTFILNLVNGEIEYKTIGYHLFLIIIKNPYIDSNSLVYAFIDRLTSHIDSLVDLQTTIAFQHILEYLLHATNEELHTRMEKAYPKLFTSTFRLFHDKNTQILSMSLLTCLVSTHQHTVQTSTFHQLNSLCLDSLHDITIQTQLANILGLLASHSSLENWTSLWNITVSECHYYLELIGIQNNELTTSAKAKVTSTMKMKSKVDKLFGIQKALLVQHIYSGLMKVLEYLLIHGNATGFLSVDLTELFPVLNGVLVFNIPQPNKQTWISNMLVENQAHISPAVLPTIVHDLKISTVHFIQIMVKSLQFSLVRYIGNLCKSLAVCLTMAVEQSKHVLLGNITLETFTSLLELYPSIILNVCPLGISTLIQLFINQINLVTLMRNSILTKSTTVTKTTTATTPSITKTQVHNAADMIGEHFIDLFSLMKAVNALVLYCGYGLQKEQLLHIESCLYKALVCMLKGVYDQKHDNNRKVQRAICEYLREDPELQMLILQISFDFVQICHPDGILSGILPILKRNCENCSSNLTTRNKATQILAYIDTMFMPSAIVIPPVSLKAFLQDEIVKAPESSITPSITMGGKEVALNHDITLSSTAVYISLDTQQSDDARNIEGSNKRDIKEVSSEHDVDGVDDDGNTSKKKHPRVDVLPGSFSSAAEEEAAANVAASRSQMETMLDSTRSSNRGNKLDAQNKAANNNFSDDDDDSLPEINM